VLRVQSALFHARLLHRGHHAGEPQQWTSCTASCGQRARTAFIDTPCGSRVFDREGATVAGLGISVRSERMTLVEMRDAFLQPLVKARDTLAERLYKE
jgi:hypothetical protein